MRVALWNSLKAWATVYTMRMKNRHQSTKHRKSNQAPAPAESGVIYKDPGGRISVALTMPNSYYVGMSSLALHLLYRAFNADEDVVCERIFWEKGAAQTGKALLSIENERPADDFDLWAFTISWEMDYFNVVELLRQAKIPPLHAMGWAPLAPADCWRSGRDDESRTGGTDLRCHFDRRRRRGSATVD